MGGWGSGNHVNFLRFFRWIRLSFLTVMRNLVIRILFLVVLVALFFEIVLALMFLAYNCSCDIASRV